MFFRDRLVILYTRSRVNTVVWGLSFLFVVSYTVGSGFLHNWFFLGAGVVGIAVPCFVRKELLRLYHITSLIFKVSGPVILAAILSTPFLFGSLDHIPLPLRVASFLYVALLSSAYFWVASDPSLFTNEDK